MAWFYVKLDQYLFYLFGVVILLHDIFFSISKLCSTFTYNLIDQFLMKNE